MSIGQASSDVKPLETRDEAFYLDLLKASKVPATLHEGLARYLAHGVPTGSFLRFVLENDAAAAIRRADQESRASLGELFIFLINAAPWPSWGSEGRVATWIADRQAVRRARVS